MWYMTGPPNSDRHFFCLPVQRGSVTASTTTPALWLPLCYPRPKFDPRHEQKSLRCPVRRLHAHAATAAAWPSPAPASAGRLFCVLGRSGGGTGPAGRRASIQPAVVGAPASPAICDATSARAVCALRELWLWEPVATPTAEATAATFSTSSTSHPTSAAASSTRIQPISAASWGISAAVHSSGCCTPPRASSGAVHAASTVCADLPAATASSVLPATAAKSE